MLFEAMALNDMENLYSSSTLDDGYGSEDSCDMNDNGCRSFRASNYEMGNSIDHEGDECESVVDNIADLLPNDPFNYISFREVNCEMGNNIDHRGEKSVGGVDNIVDLLPKDPFNFRSFRVFNWEMGNNINHRSRKSASIVDDVADLLPNDPFNMDISATVTAISGFLDGLERDFGVNSLSLVDSNEGEVKKVNNKLFAELNKLLNGPVRLRREESELEKLLHDGHIILDAGYEDVILGYEKYLIPTNAVCKTQSCTCDYADESDSGYAPDALNYALGYLSVEDLFSVERVCKSLRDSVQNDPLLWMNISIDHPLSYKITDDALVRLTNRAQGRLHSLHLLDCFKITNNSLKQVLASNPRLTKLSVTGCIKLKIDDFLYNLSLFKSTNPPGIRHLRVARILGVKSEHFDELNNLLGVDDNLHSSSHKPRFHRVGEMYLSLDDARAIDLEKCPRCLNFREVYDCPALSCLDKQQTTEPCRACSLCVPRCFRCGRCLSDRDYEENFIFYLHCLDCNKCCSDFQENATTISISPTQTYLRRFYLCG